MKLFLGYMESSMSKCIDSMQRILTSNPPQSTNQNIYISATVVSSVRFGESLLILCKIAKFDIASHFLKLNCDNTEIT